MGAVRPRVLHLNHEQSARVGPPDQRLLSDGIFRPRCAATYLPQINGL